ncbi:MAG: polymer-forming cytoskeletal protein [Maricaulaceae bacterium]
MAKSATAPSILSADLVLSGSVRATSEVQLEGSIEGDVRAGSLTVGDQAQVNGEIIAETVVIRGRVVGSVRAREVQLAASAHVEGDIIHAALAVESGAFFEGRCRHVTDPLAEIDGGNAKPSLAAPTKPVELSPADPSKAEVPADAAL